MRAPFYLFGGLNDHRKSLISEIFKLQEELPFSSAKVGNSTDTGGSSVATKPSSRSSKIKWISNRSLSEEIYYSYVLPANRAAFGVDVTPFCDIQYTEYHANENGKYDWHEDVFWGESRPFDRKLSLTIQLSEPEEYEGGNFKFAHCDLPQTVKLKGSILVFPSYLSHCVTPVTRGVRKSLVVWFEGPRWK